MVAFVACKDMERAFAHSPTGVKWLCTESWNQLNVYNDPLFEMYLAGCALYYSKSETEPRRKQAKLNIIYPVDKMRPHVHYVGLCLLSPHLQAITNARYDVDVLCGVIRLLFHVCVCNRSKI
jgi:hypothetical protein